MKKKVKKYSFFKRAAISMLCIYAVLMTLMIVCNTYAIQIIRNKIYQQLNSTLSLYAGYLEESLSNVEQFFYSLTLDTLNTNLNIIESNKQDTKFYSSIVKMKNELESSLTSSNLINGLFVFPKSNQHFIYASKGPGSTIAPTKLKEFLRSNYRTDGETDSQEDLTKKRWFPIYLNDQYYLLRIYDIGGSYVGGWIDLSGLLSYVENATASSSMVILSFEDGRSYDQTAQKTDIVPDVTHSTENYTFLQLEKKYLVISHPLSKTVDGYLSVLLDDHLITDELTNIYLMLLSTGFVFIVMIFLLAYVLVHFLQRPIGDLKQSIDSLRQGNFSTRITSKVEYEEFTEINSAFNDMVEEIKNLKINVYEEKLNKQEIEFKFLKLQVAPHFLVNCLNTIYHLSGSGKMEETQRMAVSLSVHLRYALSAESTVPIKKELEYAQNYVHISSLRYPGCLNFHTKIAPAVEDAVILPMSIITFVENTIKYQVLPGTVTEIHVDAVSVEREAVPYVHVTVWDSGEGWTQENLKVLESGSMLQSDYGHHIGIQNTYHRMAHFFGGDFSMKFSNRPGAGAQIELEFPQQKFKAGGEPTNEHSDCG